MEGQRRRTKARFALYQQLQMTAKVDLRWMCTFFDNNYTNYFENLNCINIIRNCTNQTWTTVTTRDRHK